MLFAVFFSLALFEAFTPTGHTATGMLHRNMLCATFTPADLSDGRKLEQRDNTGVNRP